MSLAWISGRSGRAVIEEAGETFLLVDGQEGPPILCSPRQLNVQWSTYSDVSTEEAGAFPFSRARLSLTKAVAVDRAHLYVLGLLDVELEEDVRQDLARELEALLADGDVAKRVEDILCSGLLPAGADLQRAIAFVRGNARVVSLLSDLRRDAPMIARACAAWSEFAMSFKTERDAAIARRWFAQRGGFHRLVEALRLGSGLPFANWMLSAAHDVPPEFGASSVRAFHRLQAIAGLSYPPVGEALPALVREAPATYETARSIPETPGDLYLAHLDVIERIIQFVSHRRGLRGDDAEDFGQGVRLRLLEDNCAVLRRHEGRDPANIASYLAAVVERMGLDYQAARWGRWRPSPLARAGGAAATRLEELVVRDGRPVDDAIETVERELPGTDRSELESLAAHFTTRSRRVFLSDELLEWIPDMAPGIDDVLVRADEEGRLERIMARLREMVSALDPEDQLAIQLRFGSGMKVADIARLVRTDPTRLYRRIANVLSRMRGIFESEGLDASAVRSMLAAPDRIDLPLPMNRDTAERHTILRGLVGSTVHGLNVNDGIEDRDEMGVCVEPLPEAMALEDPFEQFIYRSAAEREGRANARSTGGDLDLTIYSLRKWMRLALKGNPTILLLLFTPDDQLVRCDALGRELRALTPRIVSRRVQASYLGYLQAQKQRLTGERGQKRIHRPELEEMYGFDTKYAMHMLRLGFQGVELLSTGRLSLPMREPERSYLLDVRRGKVSEEECLARAGELEQALIELETTSSLPDAPDEQQAEAWMLDAYRRTWQL